MPFESIYSGLGYSGYAILNGIPIPLLPGNATENENIIKSAGSYHPDPSVSVGPISVKNRRSLPLTFSTVISPATMPLVKALTYGWRNLDLMDAPPHYSAPTEVPFELYPAVGEGYKNVAAGGGYVDELTIAGSSESLVSLNVNMTCWSWHDVPASQSQSWWGSKQWPGKGLPIPMRDAYKPCPGWQTIPNFTVIPSSSVPMNWSLTLRNNWTYQAFLGGYGYDKPPNPALITAGDLDIVFSIAWLAQRNSRPLDTGSLKLQIGGTPPGMYPSVPPLDMIYIDTLIRDPSRQFTGIGGPNEVIKWESNFYGFGSIPRSN
jgi:hypothetical protein